MERFAYNDLLKWKNSDNRKPLVLKGARQVGKTWLMKTFGQNEYKEVLYVNFEQSKNLRHIFKPDFDIQRILLALSIETGIQAKQNQTLIILDEIQEAEEGITALKYFYENAPGFHIIAAGSYLGISLHNKYAFPVGKVQLMDLYPLSFLEFLKGLNQDKYLEIIQTKHWELTGLFHDKFIELLKQYFIIGGMPEAVKSFAEKQDFEQVRRIQSDILQAYEYDFSKHIPVRELPKLRLIWEHIPSQLAKQNKKFFFSHLKKGARAKEFETALEWLQYTGLIHKVYKVAKPALPLTAYKDYKSFKVFFLDTGLLTALSGLHYQIILKGNRIFTEFKGALTEQFVLQQIQDLQPYYWSGQKTKSEVDFLVQNKQNIFPVEVKAGINPKSKSLKTFCDKFGITNAIRFSLLKYQKQDWVTNYPIYTASKYIFG